MNAQGSVNLQGKENQSQDIKQRQEEKSPQEILEEVENVVNKTQQQLLKIKTKSIFDLIPDELVITPELVTINYNHILGDTQSVTLLLRDIFNVQMEKNILYSALKIYDEKHQDEPTTIRFLRRKDAERAATVLNSLIVTKDEGIDLLHVETQGLADKFKKS